MSGSSGASQESGLLGVDSVTDDLSPVRDGAIAAGLGHLALEDGGHLLAGGGLDLLQTLGGEGDGHGLPIGVHLVVGGLQGRALEETSVAVTSDRRSSRVSLSWKYL